MRQLEDTCDRPFGNLTFWVYEHGTESETGLRFLSSHVSESVHVCRGTMVDAAAWPLSPAWLSCEFLRRQSGASRSACGCPPAHRVTPGLRQQSGASRCACSLGRRLLLLLQEAQCLLLAWPLSCIRAVKRSAQTLPIGAWRGHPGTCPCPPGTPERPRPQCWRPGPGPRRGGSCVWKLALCSAHLSSAHPSFPERKDGVLILQTCPSQALAAGGPVVQFWWC